MSLQSALGRIADRARLFGDPAPVIRSDRDTIAELARFLAKELGCKSSDLYSHQREFMYDGIRFEVYREPATEAWRQHFGALTEIYQ